MSGQLAGYGWSALSEGVGSERARLADGTRRAFCRYLTPSATRRSLSMRTLLTLLVAPFLVVAVVLCVLLLEPVRWCVVRMRPWQCRTAVVRHVAIGAGQTVVS